MKPENRMLNRLKPLVQAEGIYVEKTNNPFRSGMPDWYVEWDGGCGWIEAKYWNIKTEGKTELSASYICKKMVTPLQNRWLERSANHSVPTAILCGFPNTKHYLFFTYPVPYLDIDLQVPIITRDGLLNDLKAFQRNGFL